MRRPSLCVYCGSRLGDREAYAEAAWQVGTEIGRRGWQLVYGGGRAGLMGRVADAALAAGAPVIGVIPQSLMDREVGHAGLSELHVVQTMHERKLLMAERSDAFLALPGGIGTFEELFDGVDLAATGLPRQARRSAERRRLLRCPAGLFSSRQSPRASWRRPQRALLQVEADPVRLLDDIGQLIPLATDPDDIPPDLKSPRGRQAVTA